MKSLYLITFIFIGLFGPAMSGNAAVKGGDVDPTFNPGSFVDGEVYCLAVQTNGQIVIGGGLSGGVARLNPDGSADTNFQAVASGGAGEVDSIALQSDGKIVIGGYFSVVNGADRNCIARLNVNGSLDAGFLNGLQGALLDGSALGQVDSVAVQSGTNVFVAGYFNRFNSTVHNGIVMLSSSGGVNTSFQDNWLDSYIPTAIAVALQPDGKVLLSGDFGFVRLNPNGRRDTNFVAVVDNYVNSIVVLPNGKLLIGGLFTSINGTSRNHIARLNANGAVDASFVAGTDDRIFAIAVQPDGKVLLGGQFQTVNGVARSCFARLNSNGSLDTTFLNGLSGANNPVVFVVVQPDGRILIGGEFTTVNGVAATYVARLYGATPPLLGNFGVSANQFGFTIIGESNQVIVVEASTNLQNWIPLKTNTLGAGPLPYNDPASASITHRFYRARLQ